MNSLDISLDIFTVSRVRMWNTCPRQHFYRYVQGWAPKNKATALTRGTEQHEQLAAVYREEDKESPLALWHGKYDDIVAVSPVYTSVEQPIIRPKSPPRRELIAGVVDLLGVNKTSGKFWVVDHKTVERMYPFPVPYAIEQLSIYRSLARENFALDFAGGCISRVLYKPSAYQYALGYVLRNLKVTEGLSVTRNHLKRWETKLLPKPPRKQRGKVLWVRHRKRQRSLAFRKFDSEGQMIKSLMYIGDRYEGTLIHVERIYLPINPESEQGIWADFTESIARIDNNNTHRTAGFHCSLCPYQAACLAEYGKSAGSMIDQDTFEQRPASEEVLFALDKASEV